MTPQEKAKQLVDKYLPTVRGADRYSYNLEDMNIFIAKQCAIMCVDEILIVITEIEYGLMYLNIRDYYLEVKQEIEKL